MENKQWRRTKNMEINEDKWFTQIARQRIELKKSTIVLFILYIIIAIIFPFLMIITIEEGFKAISNDKIRIEVDCYDKFENKIEGIKCSSYRYVNEDELIILFLTDVIILFLLFFALPGAILVNNTGGKK